MAETEKKYEKASDFTLEEKMLVQLRDELYQGSWIQFLDFLNGKLKERPYIFKIHNRIEADIERIDALQRYEFKNHVNLADLLNAEEPSEN